ncbi:MAG: hypothetical protein ACOYU3_04440 [Bacillota bacterium]
MKKICFILISLLLSGCTVQTNPNSMPSPESTFMHNTSDSTERQATEQPSEMPLQPEGGYWRFVRVDCNTFEPINDQEGGTYWNGDIRSNYILATYIVTDKTNVNDPVQQEMVYNWGWQIGAAPKGDQNNLYPGNTVEILLSLEYTGIDSNKLGNYAEMYAGAFKNYPSDNRVMINGPGGTGEKEVDIEIPTGLAGQEASIDIVCTGSCPQSFTYRYIYEWIE